MWVSLKFVNAEDLHAPITREIKSREVGIRDLSLTTFEANVKRIAGSFKDVIILDGFFYLDEATLITLAQPAFVVYVAEDNIICSLIENVDDGISRAILAIQHHLNLN
ncbi:hypothetical protein CAEBREN_20322 [Caenorhabditis brenneri]|uniref:Uncharacterized protein n=1 Tax=Caenorhabditis brenneri TaxID=135651 RepID=G0NI50_CAEBE|nr:hypothetical protein CAEBREN_20322 [Caenorhabditis brenneri]